jgi:hypothetical protein
MKSTNLFIINTLLLFLLSILTIQVISCTNQQPHPNPKYKHNKDYPNPLNDYYPEIAPNAAINFNPLSTQYPNLKYTATGTVFDAFDSIPEIGIPLNNVTNFTTSPYNVKVYYPAQLIFNAATQEFAINITTFLQYTNSTNSYTVEPKSNPSLDKCFDVVNFTFNVYKQSYSYCRRVSSSYIKTLKCTKPQFDKIAKSSSISRLISIEDSDRIPEELSYGYMCYTTDLGAPGTISGCQNQLLAQYLEISAYMYLTYGVTIVARHSHSQYSPFLYLEGLSPRNIVTVVINYDNFQVLDDNYNIAQNYLPQSCISSPINYCLDFFNLCSPIIST